MKLKITSMSLLVAISVSISLKVNAANKEEDAFNNYASMNQTCPSYDPYEAVNRKIYFFNGVLDTFILRPITKGYIRFTNDYTKNRVGSFVYNIDTPLSTVQYAMQGDTKGVFKSFWRFVINTTFGIGGLFDVASKFDLNPDPQTFGNTLAAYGVGPGPYIVLPIFGPSNARGATDSLFTNNAFNPLKYRLHHDFKMVISGAKTIHERADIMPFTDYATQNSADSYIAIRDAFLHSKESKMKYANGYKCLPVK